MFCSVQLAICIALYYLNAGVTFFVYGENINVYSERNPLFKELMEAGLDYIDGFGWIVFALPFYRIYPTKAYRKYKRAVRRIQRAGEFTDVTIA